MTIDVMGLDYDQGALFEFIGRFIKLIFVVTDYLPACRGEDVCISNARDEAEHA